MLISEYIKAVCGELQ